MIYIPKSNTTANNTERVYIVGMDIIDINEFPEEIIRKSSRYIYDRSISMLCLEEEFSPYALHYASGTLFQYKGIYGIITANHVIQGSVFEKSKLIGFNYREDIHRLTIEKEFLDVHSVASSTQKGKGPDLAIIIPPISRMGYVKGVKSFVDLANLREKTKNTPIEPKYGVWGFMGTAVEEVEDQCAQGHFTGVKEATGKFLYSGFEEEWNENGFEYIGLAADYNFAPEMPSSFGGVSGGGVWQIPIRKEIDGSLIAFDPVFSGVAFAETSKSKGIRKIICHGRNAIDSVMVYIDRNIIPKP